MPPPSRGRAAAPVRSRPRCRRPSGRGSAPSLRRAAASARRRLLLLRATAQVSHERPSRTRPRCRADFNTVAADEPARGDRRRGAEARAAAAGRDRDRRRHRPPRLRGRGAGATTGKGCGEAANLEWVQSAEIPDSNAGQGPRRRRQKMQLVEGRDPRRPAPTSAAYTLFHVRQRRWKSRPDAPIGEGRVLCSMPGPQRRRNRPELRAACAPPTRAPRKPASSSRKCSETVLVDFSSHGYELAVLEIGGPAGALRQRTRASSSNGPSYEDGHRAPRTTLIAGKPKTAT